MKRATETQWNRVLDVDIVKVGWDNCEVNKLLGPPQACIPWGQEYTVCQEPLLATVKCCKLACQVSLQRFWCGHVSHYDSKEQLRASVGGADIGSPGLTTSETVQVETMLPLYVWRRTENCGDP